MSNHTAILSDAAAMLEGVDVLENLQLLESELLDVEGFAMQNIHDEVVLISGSITVAP